MAENERLIKARERLNAYYEAEIAVLTGQRYKIGSRELQRADLKEIREAIKYLEDLVNELDPKSSSTSIGTRKMFRIIPRDL